jgi:hypothetical protein
MYPPDGGSTCTLRDCIVSWANYEYSNADGHKYEKPLGSNCNYFSDQWHSSGATSCSNGWWSEQWCMDFARWVYKQSGASVSGLDHTAASARTYGVNHGTWHTAPHRGDLALWNGRGHVGIVVGMPTSTTVSVVSGNSWNPNDQLYTAIWKRTDYARSDFEGFASPVS